MQEFHRDTGTRQSNSRIALFANLTAHIFRCKYKMRFLTDLTVAEQTIQPLTSIVPLVWSENASSLGNNYALRMLQPHKYTYTRSDTTNSFVTHFYNT